MCSTLWNPIIWNQFTKFDFCFCLDKVASLAPCGSVAVRAQRGDSGVWVWMEIAGGVEHFHQMEKTCLEIQETTELTNERQDTHWQSPAHITGPFSLMAVKYYQNFWMFLWNCQHGYFKVIYRLFNECITVTSGENTLLPLTFVWEQSAHKLGSDMEQILEKSFQWDCKWHFKSKRKRKIYWNLQCWKLCCAKYSAAGL